MENPALQFSSERFRQAEGLTQESEHISTGQIVPTIQGFHRSRYGWMVLAVELMILTSSKFWV